VCSLSPVVLSTTRPRPTHSNCARENSSFFCQLCRKSFTQSGTFYRHEKSKQHQLRLINGGGNDDFFFNNNRQRQLTISTNSSNVDNNNSRKTISMPTMHKIIQLETSSRPHRSCAFWDSTSLSEPQILGTIEKQPVGSIHRSACARKPFQCDRCRKRFPERDWLAEHKVWHIEVDLDRYFKWFDLYAYPSFYCCNYFASAADVRTHIPTDHINNRQFSITIKKESSNG
jgi:hypothetical protein